MYPEAHETSKFRRVPVLVGKASWRKQQLYGFAGGFYLLPLSSSHMHIYQERNYKVLQKAYPSIDSK